MQRREVLQGVVGSVALTSVGTARAHPGPYRPLGSIAIENAKEVVPGQNGDIAYVAATGGFATVDVSVPSDPEILVEKRGLLADRETGPLRKIQDVAIEGDRLMVAGPANPLQGDVLRGLLIYDVSDPANPEQVAFHETDFPIHNCFVRDGIVFLTGNDKETNPLVLVDASDDDPTEIGRWSLIDRTERWAEVAPGLRTLHDVWVDDGRAYLAHWDAGTYVLDVSDPTAPTFVSRIGGRPIDELVEVPDEQTRAEILRLPGNAHYAMTNDDGTLLGINKEAWEIDGEGGPGETQLWDVSDVTNPTRLAAIDPPPSSDPSISGRWTTSHNFDIVGDRLFTSWYEGGVKIHDISDPSDPEELAWWRNPDETAFWTTKLAKPEFFVASSMGRFSDDRGGLYTFPNHAGQQKDPPSLTATETRTTDGETTTRATATTATTATTERTTTTEEAAFGGETATDAESDSGSAPGFGVTSAVAALLGAGAWRKLRR